MIILSPIPLNACSTCGESPQVITFPSEFHNWYAIINCCQNRVSMCCETREEALLTARKKWNFITGGKSDEM